MSGQQKDREGGGDRKYAGRIPECKAGAFHSRVKEPKPEQFSPFERLEQSLHHKQEDRGRQDDAKDGVEILAYDLAQENEGQDRGEDQYMGCPIEGGNERDQDDPKYQEKFCQRIEMVEDAVARIIK